MHSHDCSCGNHSHDEEVPSQNSSESSSDPKDVPLPDPTMISLISGLATQAMMSMGVFPHPTTGKATMMLHQAKHLIDTVDLLFEKTRGNLTDEENQTIQSVLHELRMVFVAAQKEKQRRTEVESKSPEPK